MQTLNILAQMLFYGILQTPLTSNLAQQDADSYSSFPRQDEFLL